MLSKSAVLAGHGEKKSRKREIAISCLLTSSTLRGAAKAAGIAEITMIRWLRDAQFSRDYRKARENVLKLASEELREGSLSAVRTLREIAVNKKLPASARVMAARSFLEATNLLKGTALTVNNVLPVTMEEADRAIAEVLSGMLATSPQFRQQIRAALDEAEKEEVNGEVETRKPILQ